MKTIIAAATIALVSIAAQAHQPALQELKAAAGSVELQAAPTPAARPVAQASQRSSIDQGTLLCAMDIKYRETVSHIGPVRFWKEIKGTSTIECPGKSPVKLRLAGSGLSLGLGLPNQGPFSSVNGVVAGNIAIRLPGAFVPSQLEGEYANIGGEVLGGGLSFSPWVNTDGSFNTTIYLPSSLNASIAINLNTIRFTLDR